MIRTLFLCIALLTSIGFAQEDISPEDEAVLKEAEARAKMTDRQLDSMDRAESAARQKAELSKPLAIVEPVEAPRLPSLYLPMDQAASAATMFKAAAWTQIIGIGFYVAGGVMAANGSGAAMPLLAVGGMINLTSPFFMLEGGRRLQGNYQ